VSPVRGDLSPGGSRYFDSADWGWRDLLFTSERIVSVAGELFGVEATSASLLAEGMLNETWRIHCTDRDRVLRVGRHERTAEQVRYEQRAARAWAVEVPQVVTAEHDEIPVVDGNTLTLFPFVSGDSGALVSPSVRTEAMVGVLVRLHQTSLRLGLPQRPGMSAVDERPRWFGWPGARLAIMERFGTGADVMRPLAIVDRATAELDVLLDRWQAEGRLDIRATVHGDLNPRNQLYRDGRLVGLIDTDDCRVEPLVWDVANLAYGHPDVSPAAVWRCYQALGGPLPEADEELLPAFARIGSLTAIIWLQEGDAPGTGEASHLALRNVTELAAELSSGDVRRDG
jgi:Ser/Thr protein kinase RdoA (MazF antagonist)